MTVKNCQTEKPSVARYALSYKIELSWTAHFFQATGVDFSLSHFSLEHGEYGKISESTKMAEIIKRRVCE